MNRNPMSSRKPPPTSRLLSAAGISLFPRKHHASGDKRENVWSAAGIDTPHRSPVGIRMRRSAEKIQNLIQNRPSEQCSVFLVGKCLDLFKLLPG